MLIEFFENGDEILLSSSDIFKLYSNNHKFLEELNYSEDRKLLCEEDYINNVNN